MPGFSMDNHRGSTLRHTGLAEQFTEWSLYVQTLTVLSVAVALAAVLAYHPSTRRKATTRAALEQPKTIILYGLVGALVGHIVGINELMALVVFGIGGLMRFRTVVGEPKDTGRVMLGAIVGICCGLQSYMIASLATVFAWFLVWYLERQSFGTVEILGLDIPVMARTSAAYRRLLDDAKCTVIGETRNAKKGMLSLVFTAPSSLDEALLRASSDKLDEGIRGLPGWEIS